MGEIYLGLEGIATLVSGAAAPAGRAIALWLARAGCDVAVVDTDGEAAEQIAEEIRDEDGTAIAATLGSRRGHSAAAVVRAVAAELGALDLAVNVAPAPRGESPGAVARGWRRWCRVEAAEMIARDHGGALLNVGWEAASGAAARLTRRLARELAPHRVRVNAIVTPTAAASPDPPADRIGRRVEPEDLARAAVFLSSDLARCITGQVLRVDAGAGLAASR